ncbi:MAG: DUF5676 family membrane protein [Terriglobales bacterium]
MLNIRTVALSLGIFTAITFVLCVIYGLLVPPSPHPAAPFLEMVLPGFKWLTPGGFFLGLVESFLYGAYAGLVFVPIYNFLTRRRGLTAAHEAPGNADIKIPASSRPGSVTK